MKKFPLHIRALAYLLIVTSILTSRPASQSFAPNPPLNLSRDQLALAQVYPDKTSYPRSINPDGTIKRVRAGDWTSGFFPGALWLMFESTKDPTWRTRAEQWTAGLASEQYNTSTHDVGFMLFSSFGQGYRLTGNAQYKNILLQGAKSLATRYNPNVGCIKSWDHTTYYFPVIIDNMMNLELLFWATKASGDSSFHKIAVRHALTTMAHHFRGDNSSYHLVDYDPYSGKVLAKVTHQGLHDLSDWARGQAWGLYGFTMCYRETKDLRFLSMAKRIAEFYITHPNMPTNLIPFWDFDAFDYRDASAACIASAALLELSHYVPERRDAYYNFGINTLKTLSSTTYMAITGTNNHFIIKHCVGSKPKNYEVDKPIVYADYYFLEALLLHKKPAPIVTATGGNYRITLKWNVSTGAKFYSVLSSTTTGGPYATIATNITGTQFTNTGLSTGTTYYYKVLPWNATGAGELSKEARATTNRPPTVNITSPTNNTVVTAPASFTLKANAWDADGMVSNVKFYRGTTYLKTEYKSPFECGISNLPEGTHTFTARATDNQGAQTISATITINVANATIITYHQLTSNK